MSDPIVQKPDQADAIGIVNGDVVDATTQMQNFLDELQQKLNDNLLGDVVRLTSFTVATLPPVPAVASPSLIYVSDETGGAVPAFSDGTNWRRVTDRAIVA